MSILDFLARRRAADDRAADTSAVRRIVASLERLEPERARYIAAFAYILARAALADRVISHQETHAMEDLVVRHGGLTEEQAILVVQIAKSQTQIFGGTEDFLVTREFEQIASHDQKIALIDCLFAVSAAEGGIATVEDNEIRRIAMELKIPHDEYIKVRVAHRGDLTVLREPPESGRGR